MYTKRHIEASKGKVGELVAAIEQDLKHYDLNTKVLYHVLLMVEETAVQLIENAAGNAKLTACVRKKHGNIIVDMDCKGQEFSFTDAMSYGGILDSQIDDADLENSIRSVVMTACADELRYKNKAGHNKVQVMVKRAEQKRCAQMIGAIILAFAIVFILQLFPKEIGRGFSKYLFTPVKDMFLNSLKAIATPVVFFSIACSVAQFGNFGEFRKRGAEVIGMYLFTTVFAIIFGVGIFGLIQPDYTIAAGNEVGGAFDSIAQSAAQMDNTLVNMITHIVPSDIVSPFLNGDMLQIIFLAVVCGVALGQIGEYVAPVKTFFEGFNALFLKIAGLQSALLPIAIICIFPAMAFSASGGSKASSATTVGLVKLAIGVFAGYVGMLILYCLLLLIIVKVNPLVFLKKYGPGMLLTMTMGSSSAAMPFNLQYCEKLGADRSIYSFSIPLGTTINMDGTTIYLTICSLFCAKLYGIELTPGLIVSVMISVLILSVGAPGIVGATLICLAALFTQLGVPMEALGLIMGIEATVGSFRILFNCSGDVVISMVVSKMENVFNKEKYYSK